MGRPALSRVVFSSSDLSTTIEWDPAERWSLGAAGLGGLAQVAALERASTHPLALAIVSLADKLHLDELELKEHKVVPGLGVEAKFEGQLVLIGRQALLQQNEKQVPQLLLDGLTRLQLDGCTTSVAFTEEGTFGFAFSDQVRKEASMVMESLKQVGVNQIHMLTGDRIEPAQKVANLVGITEVHAHLLPDEKTSLVRSLAESCSVMMDTGWNVLDGDLPLPVAVLGHEGSTVFVILNGLRMLSGPGDLLRRITS